MTIERSTETTELVLDRDQVAWTEQQRTALAHIGVENASEGDLQVFFHVCKRTGLDPFARQIYMIGRQSSEKRGSEWVKVVKQTIQTGIDGFRLIGRRAADHAGHSISVEPPEWADDSGNWRPLWTKTWGAPLAARVTIVRNGQPFTAVAMYDEYAQTKRSGEPTQMWEQRPAGQLAKCAEAAAWRMAFPQDLSGIYSADEMQQADSPPTQPTRAGSLANVIGAPAAPALERDEEGQMEAMHAAFNDAGITERQDRLDFAMATVNREIESSTDLTWDERSAVIDALRVITDDLVADEPLGGAR